MEQILVVTATRKITFFFFFLSVCLFIEKMEKKTKLWMVLDILFWFAIDVLLRTQMKLDGYLC